jgi:hypothetical protein
MKAYILSEADFQLLLTMIDRSPKYGEQGGSSAAFTKEELQAQDKAHGFYNYQVRTWIDKVQK